MIIIVGILLLGGAGTIGGLAIAGNLSAPAMYAPRVAGHVLPSLSPLGLFCAGMAVAFLLCFGMWMVGAGVIARHRRAIWDPVDDFMPGEWRTS